MNHKPMLAVDCGGLDKLPFPCVISPKMDGVRAIVSANGLLSRRLLRIPNVNAQALYEGLPIGLDGELLAGNPCASDVYRKTVSMVMSDDKPVDGLVYHVFDYQQEWPWEERQGYIDRMREHLPSWVEVVPQIPVADLEELLHWEDIWVTAGYEGLIARKPGSPYKHGRSTGPQGYLLKVKRFVDAEARVIGMTELMHNGNEAKTNALGHTERSHKKAGLVGTGTMGNLIVQDVKTGVEFEIGTGFTAADRKSLWLVRDKVRFLQLAKYKHFPVGAKDKPRHPVFLGWRDSRDL